MGTLSLNHLIVGWGFTDTSQTSLISSPSGVSTRSDLVLIVGGSPFGSSAEYRETKNRIRFLSYSLNHVSHLGKREIYF